jgi:hypothetical protein
MKKIIISISTAVIMITSAHSAPITTVKDGKCYDEKIVWTNLVKTKLSHPKLAEAKALAEKGIANQKGPECEILVQQAIDLIKN